jgi:hypothetical protein
LLLALTGLLGFLDARAFFVTELLRFAAERFAFATGRFFPLPFFFAMVSLLLRSSTAPYCESIPEHVRCHLRMMLESIIEIAYALPSDTR